MKCKLQEIELSSHVFTSQLPCLSRHYGAYICLKAYGSMSGDMYR